MHLNDLKTLFTYNAWANERVLTAVEQLSPEQYRKDLISSHGGVHGTLAHLAGAEDVWLKRWKSEPITGILRAEDLPSFDALRSYLRRTGDGMREFCGGLATEEAIAQDLVYRDMKGNEYRQPLYQLMLHLVNHSTFHRGQVVAMLRQLGAKPLTSDLVVFLRDQAR